MSSTLLLYSKIYKSLYDHKSIKIAPLNHILAISITRFPLHHTAFTVWHTRWKLNPLNCFSNYQLLPPPTHLLTFISILLHSFLIYSIVCIFLSFLNLFLFLRIVCFAVQDDEEEKLFLCFPFFCSCFCFYYYAFIHSYKIVNLLAL